MTIMGLNWLNYAETLRDNLVSEAIKQGQLGETVRTNKVNEGLKSRGLDELVRSDLRNENLTQQQRTETKRADLVHEAQSWSSIGETHRTNVANEKIKSGNLKQLIHYQDTSLTETNRSNVAKEVNTKYVADLSTLTKQRPIIGANVANYDLGSLGYGMPKEQTGALQDVLSELSNLSPFAILAGLAG